MRPLALAVTLLALLSACGDDAGGGAVSPAPAGAPWKKLSQWHLFKDGPGQVPNDGVYAYDVTSPLFSDYTAKHRFFWLPDGAKITYRDDKAWDLPVGAIVIKSFGYVRDLRDPSQGERVLETRLLVREPGGWIPHTYVWDADDKDAVLQAAGDFVNASWIDASGATQTHRYVVPNTNECQECHGKEPLTSLLGLKTAQLEGLAGENLIDSYQADGLFATAPSAPADRPRYAAPDDESASVSDRARAYVDANCAHCHNPDGDAKAKALYLDFAHTAPTGSPVDWGTCKIPTSAGGATCGYTYDIVPGDSGHSVMICRMESAIGADQMPPLGRSFVHAEGVALIKAWIDSMTPDDCL
ncbi:MAG: hypothetical protein U1F43_28370 [Myxococcota bacterium]